MFSKICKNMSTKQEILSDATFKAWLFSSDFDFSCKDGQVTAATWKYYCPLVANPTITNCCKELHLKCGRVSYICFWKCHHAWKLVRFCVKTSLFLLFQNIALSEVTVFYSDTFYDDMFLISLLHGCYHYLVFMDPVNVCSKSKFLLNE